MDISYPEVHMLVKGIGVGNLDSRYAIKISDKRMTGDFPKVGIFL